MAHPKLDRDLVIVPAGAGAGKTHRIKTQLSDWVKSKTVRPERILAVTFTEAAASELRERIRSGLLANGLVSEAMAVERAYVSTIHGLGLRILTEHALAAGSSPQPRHLGDAERDLLIRQALAHSKALDPIKQEPERYGYSANWQRGESVEDSLRARVLAMIDLLRGLGETGRDRKLIEPALARLDAIYGPTLADPVSARDALLKAIELMLTAFPEGGMATITSKGPREALENNLALFQRVRKKPHLLENDWQVWQDLRGLWTSNSRTKTPDGYDELALAIIAQADALPSHPGPLEDAKKHLLCLITCAQEVMQAYEERKKALGLIDFADMITGAEALLRKNPEVRQAVLDEIDCVIIDEFQDTNPVQFALLWQLGANVPRTLLVGDVKQSIMGFQGADPRLSQALAKSNPASTQPLDRNWRSTPAVMKFVNAMGEGLFSEDYNPLAPTRDPVDGIALEILDLHKSRAVRTASKPQEHVAERIACLLNSAETITDRHTKSARPIRPSDIALLVCRHSTATRYADELRMRGVPVRIAENGWLNSSTIRAAIAALSYAANPQDIHAALLLRTLGPDPISLQDALSAQLDGQLARDGVLERLREISDSLLRLPASAAVNLVVDTANIRPWAASQRDALQARADLLRLEAEAIEFEKAHRDLKAASGFHGETIKVFLGWLTARAGERDFDRRPDPSANTAEAVEIVTWHASKGREWPITIVAEFDNSILERPGTTSVSFEALDQIDDIASVLASAKLIHTPSFVAPEAQKLFIEDRRSDFEAIAKNLLYVSLTRARDRLIIEWPSFLKDREEDAPEASCLFHVFKDNCKPILTDNALRLNGAECDVHLKQMADIAGFTELKNGLAFQSIQLGKADRLATTQLTPWRVQPSSASAVGKRPVSRTIQIGTPWEAVVNDALRGSALHLAIHGQLLRQDLEEELAAATGLNEETLTLVADRAEALKAWLSDAGYSELHCEIPVLYETEVGTLINGTIDLLAVGPKGSILIDHKSGGSGEGLGPYWPQLAAYADLVAKLFPKHPLQGIGIFWIDHGSLELVGQPSVAVPTEPRANSAIV
ncbi:AAA family ATPase [Brucella anthropi]|uniref:DNA 3'-5' helicase n=2 Tax=Brucella anthropi TaxID=529 RepID=A0A6L3Z0X6_BRUAN|nr:AAA family ATPase [Brucella anthropi]